MPNRTELLSTTLATFAALSTGLAVRAGDCPATQAPKLLASDGAPFDRFGIYVDVDNVTAISGAYLHNAVGPSSGAAYVFERQPDGTWVEQDKLIANDGGMGDWFGVSVAINGNLALIGAQLHDAAAQDSGAAYVFVRAGDRWMQETKLVANDAGAGDWAGHSVALSGDLAVMSAQYNQEAGLNAGASYVFRRTGTGEWMQEDKVIGSDTSPGDEFGTSVATDGETVVVGARRHDAAGADSGGAYVFAQSEDGWVETMKLQPDDLEAGDEFGFAVAVDGDWLVVGSRLDDDAGTNAGAAYVYRRDDRGEWVVWDKLIGSDVGAEDRLAETVSIDGDLIVIGARQHDEAASDGGAAYVFQRDADDQWNEVAKLIGSDVATMHFFGISVAVDGSRVMAGANLDNELGDQAGAAYIFDLECGGEIPGDLDGDGSVNGADLLMLLNAWGQMRSPADLDGDGQVAGGDLLILLNNWG